MVSIGLFWKLLQKLAATNLSLEGKLIPWTAVLLFMVPLQEKGVQSLIYILLLVWPIRLTCVCRCTLKARDWGNCTVVQPKKYNLAHFLLSAKIFEVLKVLKIAGPETLMWACSSWYMQINGFLPEKSFCAYPCEYAPEIWSDLICYFWTMSGIHLPHAVSHSDF